MSANALRPTDNSDHALAHVASDLMSLLLDHSRATNQESLIDSTFADFDGLLDEMQQAASSTRRLIEEAEALLR
jgi:hypothetical protein